MNEQSAVETLKNEFDEKLHNCVRGRSIKRISGFWINDEDIDDEELWNWITTNRIWKCLESRLHEFKPQGGKIFSSTNNDRCGGKVSYLFIRK